MNALPSARFWLAAILLAALAFLAGDLQGFKRAQHAGELKEQVIQKVATKQLADAIQAARQTEQALVDHINAIATKFHQEQTHAQFEHDRLSAAIHAGTVRLSIPVRAHFVATTCPDPAVASGDQPEARAELTPAAGSTLVAIAKDGDDAIRQLNACIDAYATAEKMSHVQTP